MNSCLKNFISLFLLFYFSNVHAQISNDTITTKSENVKQLNDSIGIEKSILKKPKQKLERKNYSLQITSSNNAQLLAKLNYKKSFFSDEERKNELQNILNICYGTGYLAAAYDSIFYDSVFEKVELNFGKQYKWLQLAHGNVDEGALSEIGFREKLYSNKTIYFKNIKLVQEKLIKWYENNGFPFASIKLDSIKISEEKISAQLNLTKNKKQKIDSISIKGNAKISKQYLQNYLGVKEGSLYNEAQLKKTNTRLAELPFVRATKPVNIIFSESTNKLILYLDKKRASQFDGILGILPDNKSGKVLFTGDVQLKLQNGLGKGELIDLNWRKLQNLTQDLKIRLVYPFIFRSPFGIDYDFKLYKKDTTYLDVNHNAGIQYLLIGGNYLKIFYNNKTSTLIAKGGYQNATVLPAFADVTTNMYGLGLKYEKLDYRLNPRKGFSIFMNGSAGEKKIKKNLKINQELYKGLHLTTPLYKGDFDGSLFIPVANRSTVKIGIQSAFIYGLTTFENELFKIGGLKSLRGFDEESIYASTYAIGSIEYRFLLEQNSYLFLFGNGAWYENKSVKQKTYDTPYGFGAGISFETKAGIFSINYALGSQYNQQLQLRSGKIHFGIVNYF